MDVPSSRGSGPQKYGAVVCPHCHGAWGVRLDSKRVKCPRCGKSVLLDKLDVKYSSNNLKMVAAAVQKINIPQ